MKRNMDRRMALRLGDALLRMTDHIPCINSGGCLRFALALYDALRREGYCPRIIDISDYTHAVVKVGKFAFDSDGLYSENIEGMLRHTGQLYGRNKRRSDGRHVWRYEPAPRARGLVQDRKQWNQVFDKRRSRSFPRIAEKAVAEMLRDTTPEYVLELLR